MTPSLDIIITLILCTIKIQKTISQLVTQTQCKTRRKKCPCHQPQPSNKGKN